MSCWVAFPGVTKFEKPYSGQVHKLGMQNEVYTDYAETKKLLSTSVGKTSYSNNNTVKNDRENRKRHQNCSSNHLRMGSVGDFSPCSCPTPRMEQLCHVY